MIVKIGPKGQITIPKSYRKSLNISPGDSILITESEGQLILRKETIFDFIGSIPPTEGSADWDDIRAEAKRERAEIVSKSIKNRD